MSSGGASHVKRRSLNKKARCDQAVAAVTSRAAARLAFTSFTAAWRAWRVSGALDKARFVAGTP